MAREDRFPAIRPRPTLGGLLDNVARAGFPAICTVLLMLLTQAPFGIPGQAELLPSVTLGCIWFWSLFRPSSMPPPAVFAIGMLFDLLGYMPLGVGALTLLATYGVAVRWRRTLARRGFALTWLAFLPIATGAAGVCWALVALLTWQLIPPGPAIFQAVLTSTLYPVLAIPLARAHRSILGAESV